MGEIDFIIPGKFIGKKLHDPLVHITAEKSRKL